MGSRQVDWGSICSNGDSVLVCCGERALPKDKAFSLIMVQVDYVPNLNFIYEWWVETEKIRLQEEATESSLVGFSHRDKVIRSFGIVGVQKPGLVRIPPRHLAFPTWRSPEMTVYL